MVGDDTGVGAKTAEVFQSQLQKLGVKVNFRQVPHDVMYSKLLQRARRRTSRCARTSGALPDFPDGQAELDPTFNGASIVPENNSNWPQLNDPQINNAIDAAKPIVDTAERARRARTSTRWSPSRRPAVPWIWDKQANIELVRRPGRDRRSGTPTGTSATRSIK